MLAEARVLNTIASNDNKLISSPLRTGPPAASLNWEPPAISGRPQGALQQLPQQQQRRRPISASRIEADPFAPPNEATRAPKAARTAVAASELPRLDDGGGGGVGGGGGGALFPFTMKREDSMSSMPPKTRRSRSDVTPLRAPPLLSQQPILPAVGNPSSYVADSRAGGSGVLAMLKAKEPIVGFPSPFKDATSGGGGLPPVAPSALMRNNRFSSGIAGGTAGGTGTSGRAPPPLAMQASATDLPMRQAALSPQRGSTQSPQRLPPPLLQDAGQWGGQTGQRPGGLPSPQRRSQRSSGGGGGGVGGPLPQLLPRLGPSQSSGQFGQGSTIRMSSGSTVRVQESLTFDDDGNEIEDDGVGIPRSRFLASLARDANASAPWNSR